MVWAAATVRRKNEATTEMANNPQKSNDPTQETLAAIQDALSVRSNDPRAFADSEQGHAPRPPVTADLFHQNSQNPDWAAEDSSPRRAANDDRATIGQIL